MDLNNVMSWVAYRNVIHQHYTIHWWHLLLELHDVIIFCYISTFYQQRLNGNTILGNFRLFIVSN